MSKPPTIKPSASPSKSPSLPPSSSPSREEDYNGGGAKSRLPSFTPTALPTAVPTTTPTATSTGVQTEVPTVQPTTQVTSRAPSSGANGDPHFKTWSGERYDFHGICDLTLLANPSFLNDIGMDIYIRSKQTLQWSYISTAVIRIGDETFEVSGHHDGDSFWLNGIQGNGDDWKDGTIVGGYPVSHRKIGRTQRQYTINLGNKESIVFKTWKDFVRVDVVGATPENFGQSLGLMGTFPKGVKVGRDGTTVFNDYNKFGQEWQVLSSDPNMFHSVEGPQHPSRCELPVKSAMRRRLTKSTISREEAERLCSHLVDEEERDLCAFDIMATNDEGAAQAY